MLRPFFTRLFTESLSSGLVANLGVEGLFKTDDDGKKGQRQRRGKHERGGPGGDERDVVPRAWKDLFDRESVRVEAARKVAHEEGARQRRAKTCGMDKTDKEKKVDCWEFKVETSLGKNNRCPYECSSIELCKDSLTTHCCTKVGEKPDLEAPAGSEFVCDHQQVQTEPIKTCAFAGYNKVDDKDDIVKKWLTDCNAEQVSVASTDKKNHRKPLLGRCKPQFCSDAVPTDTLATYGGVGGCGFDKFVGTLARIFNHLANPQWVWKVPTGALKAGYTEPGTDCANCDKQIYQITLTLPFKLEFEHKNDADAEAMTLPKFTLMLDPFVGNDPNAVGGAQAITMEATTTNLRRHGYGRKQARIFTEPIFKSTKNLQGKEVYAAVPGSSKLASPRNIVKNLWRHYWSILTAWFRHVAWNSFKRPGSCK